ncbi:hypothetical protein FRC00_012303, partial [Tulasnella sp. 408]
MSADSGSTLDPASGCSSKCTGDSSKTCGGGWAVMIYYNAAMDSGSCSYSATATTTTSAPRDGLQVEIGDGLLTGGLVTTLVDDNHDDADDGVGGAVVVDLFSLATTISYSATASTGIRPTITTNNGGIATEITAVHDASSLVHPHHHNYPRPSSSSSFSSFDQTGTASVTASTTSASPSITGTPTATGNGWVSYDKAKDGKLVVAHFMVGNTYSYDKAMWTKQINLAKAQGIDAFVLNFGALDWEYSRMQDGYDAASALGFKMFLSFDMTSLTCGSWSDTASISSTIVRWANHAAQLKDSTGAVYVGTFSGENCWFGQGDFAAGWYQAVKAGPSSSGVKTKFIPSFFPVGSHSDMYTSFMDGTFPWNNAWPMGNYDIPWSGDASTVNGLDRSRGQVYMAPVSPWFFTHYGVNSWNKNWIYRADNWMYNVRWEQIMSARSGVDLVQIITWNDYGESHYVGPIEVDQPNSNAWVDGFDHT